MLDLTCKSNQGSGCLQYEVQQGHIKGCYKLGLGLVWSSVGVSGQRRLVKAPSKGEHVYSRLLEGCKEFYHGSDQGLL